MTKPASWFHVDRSDDESEKDKGLVINTAGRLHSPFHSLLSAQFVSLANPTGHAFLRK